jgi:hypothetical protein
MNIQDKTIWQIAAGNGDRTHFAKLCLDEDVVIIGPGRYGPWPGCKLPMLADKSADFTPRKAGMIRRFVEDIAVGDLVVLRVGTQQVYGVGEVASGYQFNQKFANVQTWDLQHVRRVRWLWKADPRPQSFPTYALKFGNSVQYLISPEVQAWLRTLSVPESAYERQLRPL